MAVGSCAGHDYAFLVTTVMLCFSFLYAPFALVDQTSAVYQLLCDICDIGHIKLRAETRESYFCGDYLISQKVMFTHVADPVI